MPEGRSPSKHDPSTLQTSDEELRRILELELLKIRNEASAARLEARAAEIELMMRRLGQAAGPGYNPGPTALPTASHSPIASPHFSSSVPATASHRFDSWSEVRDAQSRDRHGEVVPPLLMENDSGANDSVTRIDGPQPKIRRPQYLDIARTDALSDDTTERKVEQATIAAPGEDETAVEGSAATAPRTVANEDASSGRQTTGDVQFEPESDLNTEAETRRRGKPAAWLVSTVVHVGVILALAAIGLQTHRPKDQVALSASTASANETSIETFEIESSEPESDPQPSEPMASDTAVELSPVGEFSAADFAPDAPPAPPTPAVAAIASSSAASAAAASLKSDAGAKIQFCGVEGGGNHFVYLVDSSGSMGDGFESARAELLSSIDLLKPDQRFYVVFFDAKPDYMRLSNPRQDEARSVYATPKNKAALRRWAMRISKDRGKAPYDPLRFALKQKADVIFLLSDGEFPQGIENLLKEENKIENLFGESNPISIVHTISYFSQEGESRMRRIAQQNQGQYRYVPKP